jgi:hypothetical protein
MGATPLREPSAHEVAWLAHHQTFVHALEKGDRDLIEAAYEPLKSILLAMGATGQLPLSAMEVALGQYSDLRKAAEQVIKAASRLAVWHSPKPVDTFHSAV